VKVKAKISFAGKVSMGLNEIREIKDKAVLKDLLRVGYVEVVEENAEKLKKTKKKVITDENQ